MNIKKIIVSIMFIFFPVFSLFAQETHPIDKLEEECIKKNYTTAGMNNCAAKAYKQWEDELITYYMLLMSILSNEEKQQLQEAQIAWVKYRDLETKFRVGAFLNNQGTMYSNLAMAEKLDIVRQRALVLSSLYDVLKEARN